MFFFLFRLSTWESQVERSSLIRSFCDCLCICKNLKDQRLLSHILFSYICHQFEESQTNLLLRKTLIIHDFECKSNARWNSAAESLPFETKRHLLTSGKLSIGKWKISYKPNFQWKELWKVFQLERWRASSNLKEPRHSVSTFKKSYLNVNVKRNHFRTPKI